MKIVAGERHAVALALAQSPPAKRWDKDKQWRRLLGRCSKKMYQRKCRKKKVQKTKD